MDSSNRIGYRRLADILRTRINNGTYAVGALLPSIDSLVAEHGASRNVVRDALYSLRDNGIIDIVAGIGSTVLVRPVDLPPPERDRIIAELAHMRRRFDHLEAEIAELRDEVRQPRPQEPRAARRGPRVQPESPRGRQPSTS